MSSLLQRPGFKNLSQSKQQLFIDAHAHLYPARIDTLLEGGINFVPDARKGYRYWDMDGRELMDLHLNGGTFNLGHGHPELVELMRESLSNWDIGNHHFCSAPKVELAKALVNCSPGQLQYVVFTPSASEANDVAIKSARRATGRKKIVALDCAYHGRTGLSGAAGDDESARYFNSDQPEDFIKVPFNDLDAMADALKHNDVALVMMEPLPATAGFPLPFDGYLQGVKTLCEAHGTLFLADEVQTGLGRSGYNWAIEKWQIEPDFLVCGKGLSGGLYPMAAVLMTASAGAWVQDSGWGHVSTFGGSDLGCIVAKRALELSLADSTRNNVTKQAQTLRAGLEALLPRFPFFVDIRQQGLIFGLRFQDRLTGYGMMKALYECGVWAFVAGFDESVLQFKPGLLIDDAFSHELLRRVEHACVWYVNHASSLILGAEPDPDSPALLAARQTAREALKYWNLETAELHLLKHRENTVFRVDPGNGQAPCVLRVHRTEYHSDSALQSELMWMAALNESGIECPLAINTTDGRPFVHVVSPLSDMTHQVSMVTWVEGKPFDDLGKVERGVIPETCERYRALGALAGKLHNQSQRWNPPAGFTRHAWDEEGLLGENPNWGRFWEHPVLTAGQRRQILKARTVLKALLKQLGKAPERYGLIHSDFLPENILCDKDTLRLIDFDDSGYGWHLFEMATSLFPQLSQPYFDQIQQAYVEGYRTERELSADDLEILPAFLMIRGFSYLGWLMTRRESLPNADRLAREIAKGLCEFIPELLAQLNPFQRMGVEILTWFSNTRTDKDGLSPAS